MWRRSLVYYAASMVYGVLAAGAVAQSPTGQVDFARQILPILSNKCFTCHGPDTRKKDLVRLDSYAGATRDLGGYRAIDPQNLASSQLLARIHDAEDPMPPAKADKQLTEAERGLLSRWVAEGGKYARHWAFVPPRKGVVAAGAHAIDSFVQARFAGQGLGFASPASRSTLARRVALVLTGLPPRPEVLKAFLADDQPGAYESLVESLFADPRFGEHQARYWLDAVRYGDTHGLHLDNRRGIYPYRDWVVRAFNDNLPLDDFITWQLAGDLLPDPTLAQQVATGYVRMNPSTAEGGAIPAEFQAKNSFDRTESFGTVMLGMTLTCARCHTHKYDPIPQTEYYRLLAFFNSTAESPMDGNRYAYAPVIEAPSSQEAWQSWAAIQTEMQGLLGGVDVAGVGMKAVAYAKASQAVVIRDWRISKPLSHTASLPAGALSATKKLPGVIQRQKLGPDKAVWVSFEVQTPASQTLWLHFTGGAKTRVSLDGEPIESPQMSEDQRRGMLPLTFTKGKHTVQIHLVGHVNPTPIEVRTVNPWQSLVNKKAWSSCKGEDRVLMIADPAGPFGKHEDQSRALRLAVRITLAKLNFTTTLVARELGKPRPTRVLYRGEYNLPTGHVLQPDVLTVMGSLPKDAPRNRLGLARWLTSREHPLASRVLTNRIWQRTFGLGLVRTPEDFGRQGEQPTHPELLDWLAVELQDSGWDMRHMLRLMVTSRTFRQSSARRQGIDDPENRLLSRGPSHRLDAEVIRDIALWASGLLDPAMGGEGVKPYQPGGMWSALAHPGSNTKKYVADRGSRLYRRSLYVYWKRTSPHPMMTLFDAPSRETSCVARSRTSTPLQSLGLFNETQRLEMSRVFAERLIRDVRDDSGRIGQAFELLACRQPTDRERRACERLLGAMRLRYQKSKSDARSLLDRTGSASRVPNLDPVELAVWTQVAITVLASDVVLTLY
jgi:hypothetical protein